MLCIDTHARIPKYSSFTDHYYYSSNGLLVRESPTIVALRSVPSRYPLNKYEVWIHIFFIQTTYYLG